MRLLLIGLALFLFVLPAAAQNERITVGVVPFSHTQGARPEHAASIFSLTQTSLATSGRLNLVEVEQLDALKEEVDEQGDELYLDGVPTELAPEGAEYLILGTLNTAIAVERENHMGYDGYVSYELRRVSVGSRRIACSHLIEKKNTVKDVGKRILGRFLSDRGGEDAADVANSLGGRDTPEAAIRSAIKNTEAQVSDFVAKCFPLEFEILSVEKTGKKGRIEEVLISGGDTWGLKAKDKLTVIQRTPFVMPDGTTTERERVIARLEVVEVQGPSFSLCKVAKNKKGREKLRDAQEAGKALIVTTNPVEVQ